MLIQSRAVEFVKANNLGWLLRGQDYLLSLKIGGRLDPLLFLRFGVANGLQTRFAFALSFTQFPGDDAYMNVAGFLSVGSYDTLFTESGAPVFIEGAADFAADFAQSGLCCDDLLVTKQISAAHSAAMIAFAAQPAAAPECDGE